MTAKSLIKYVPIYKCKCCGVTFNAEEAIEYHCSSLNPTTYELFSTDLRRNLANQGYSPLWEELNGSGRFYIPKQMIHVCDCVDVYYGLADLVGFEVLKGENNG